MGDEESDGEPVLTLDDAEDRTFEGLRVWV